MWTIRDRRRQRALARTRDPLDGDAFTERMEAAGVVVQTARFLWAELQPYYVAPLTPYPEDRIHADMKIDPDDISAIAIDFERRFDLWFGENPIDCPADPTIAELGLALDRAGR